MPAPWIVLHEGRRLRWGGDLRRHHLFLQLAERTGGDLVDGWSASVVRAALTSRRAPRWQPWRTKPRLASVEVLGPDLIAEACRVADLAVLDVHDDPLAQHAAFGIPIAPEREARLRAVRDANRGAFRWFAAPSASFAELAALDPTRTLVATNGTDTRHIVPRPMPERPAVGMISGAAPRRGIETLVAAARQLRSSVADLRLLLWLVATGTDSQAFLDELTSSLELDSWIELRSVGYADLGDELAESTVLVVPHPAGAYMDSALPVKLFDSMAAGRPVVVTPRLEMRAVVERHGAGFVTADDSPESLASAIETILADPGLASRLGEAGRAAAESTYDWRVIGSRLADAILERAP